MTTATDVVGDVSAFLNCSEWTVFALSFIYIGDDEWTEMADYASQMYQEEREENGTDKAYDMLPPCVVNFAIDLMSGRLSNGMLGKLYEMMEA